MKRYAVAYREPMIGNLAMVAGVVVVMGVTHAWHVHSRPRTLGMTMPVNTHAAAAYAVPVRAMAAVESPAPIPAAASQPPPSESLSAAGDNDTIVVVAPPRMGHADGLNLDITSPGSLWAKAGARYHIDPVLIYSVALVETRGVQPDGSVAPSPWVVRINGHLHNGTRAETEHAIELANLLAVPVQDVGIMQVYYPMHRDIEPDPIALLNPVRNIDIGTRLLRKAMQESRDPVLRIGYYHSHDVALARGYGETVLDVYRQLKAALGKPSTSVVAFGRVRSDVFVAHAGG